MQIELTPAIFRDGHFYCHKCNSKVEPSAPWTFGFPNEHGSTYCSKCKLSMIVNVKPTGSFYGFSYWATHIHDYKEVDAESIGKPSWNCYHYYQCTICKVITSIDSSD